MIAIEIDVTGSPEQSIARVRTFIGGDAIRKIAGYEGQRTVREHLQGLDDSRANKLGGRRSHYYGSARRATEFQIEGEDVIISISQVGMKLHYFGGTVTAGKNSSYATGSPARYLTIPATPEAYGRTVRDFPDLVVVWGKNRRPVGLAIGEEATGSLYSAVARRHGAMLTKKAKLTPGKMMFWLKESVTLPPDSTVLPTEDTLGMNIMNRISGAIVRRFEGEDVTGGFEEGGGI